MRVTALLFREPGRGEFYRKHIDMPDANMPKTANEFGQRSLKAVSHFWPEAAIGKAMHVDKSDSGKRYVVEGQGWSVEWATDAHVAEQRDFMEKYMKGEYTSEQLIVFAMEIQPAERRVL